MFLLQNAIHSLFVNRFRSTCAERNTPSVLIHKHLICAKRCPRSTLVNRIVILICSNICLLYVHFRSRSTPVDPNAFPICSTVFSLDVCRSKCVSYVLRCVLARRLSIQMRFLYAKPSRDNPAVPNDTSVPPQMDMFQTGTSDGYFSKHKFYDSRA